MPGDLGWRKLVERREEMKVVWSEIGRNGRESTGVDGGGETERGRRNRMVGRV